MRRFFKSRRGAAMEMAILMAVVMFALSTLVLTTSLLQHNRMNRAEMSMTQGIVLDQIGEDFCAAVVGNTGDGWMTPYQEDYNIVVLGKTLMVTDKQTDELLLQVALTPAGANRYTVTQWTKK